MRSDRVQIASIHSAASHTRARVGRVGPPTPPRNTRPGPHRPRAAPARAAPVFESSSTRPPAHNAARIISPDAIRAGVEPHTAPPPQPRAPPPPRFLMQSPARARALARRGRTVYPVHDDCPPDSAPAGAIKHRPSPRLGAFRNAPRALGFHFRILKRPSGPLCLPWTPPTLFRKPPHCRDVWGEASALARRRVTGWTRRWGRRRRRRRRGPGWVVRRTVACGHAPGHRAEVRSLGGGFETKCSYLSVCLSSFPVLSGVGRASERARIRICISRMQPARLCAAACCVRPRLLPSRLCSACALVTPVSIGRRSVITGPTVTAGAAAGGIGYFSGGGMPASGGTAVGGGGFACVRTRPFLVCIFRMGAQSACAFPEWDPVPRVHFPYGPPIPRTTTRHVTGVQVRRPLARRGGHRVRARGRYAFANH